MSTKSKKRAHGVHRAGAGTLTRRARKHVAQQTKRFMRLLDLGEKAKAEEVWSAIRRKTGPKKNRRRTGRRPSHLRVR
jgi:hypothetical protein